MKAYTDPLVARRRSAEANHERFKEYIARSMVEAGFEEVPGTVHRIALQNNSDHSLQLERPEPTETDMALFPEYVREVHYFEWDTAKIKADLISGALPADACPFAKVTRGKHARFHFVKAEKPAKLPAKKGKKA